LPLNLIGMQRPSSSPRGETAGDSVTIAHRQRFYFIIDALDKVMLDVSHLEYRYSKASTTPDVASTSPNLEFRRTPSYRSVQWHYADTLTKSYDAYFVKAKLYDEDLELKAVLLNEFRTATAFLGLEGTEKLSMQDLMKEIGTMTKDFPESMEDLCTALAQMLVQTLLLEDKAPTYGQFRT
jgi:hypothetical protein